MEKSDYREKRSLWSDKSGQTDLNVIYTIGATSIATIAAIVAQGFYTLKTIREMRDSTEKTLGKIDASTKCLLEKQYKATVCAQALDLAARENREPSDTDFGRIDQVLTKYETWEKRKSSIST